MVCVSELSLIYILLMDLDSMGLTRSYAGLVVCRFLLGLFEAGFFPGQQIWKA